MKATSISLLVRRRGTLFIIIIIIMEYVLVQQMAMAEDQEQKNAKRAMDMVRSKVRDEGPTHKLSSPAPADPYLFCKKIQDIPIQQAGQRAQRIDAGSGSDPARRRRSEDPKIHLSSYCCRGVRLMLIVQKHNNSNTASKMAVMPCMLYSYKK